jgi:hypothetical protein
MKLITPQRRSYNNTWARNAYAKNPEKYRAKAAAWRTKNPEKTNAAVKKYIMAHPRKYMFTNKKKQAAIKGIEFTITFNDIIWPDLCPILGIPLVYQRWRGTVCGPYDDSPSFDRINPELGYVLGNVQIISNRANRIKGNGTPEEIMKIALWLNR